MNIWKDTSQEARKERWKALWDMEDLPRPLWFVPADPTLAITTDRLSKGEPVNRFFEDLDYQLDESLKWNRFAKKMLTLLAKDDFVLRLQPQKGIGVIASAFGCPTEFPEYQFPMTHPVIKATDPPERVYEIEKPGLRHGLLGEVLDYAQVYSDRAGGTYPIAMTDLQGPIDTVYLIWDTTALMMAMYDAPETVHHLMNMVTDLMIDFIKDFQSRVKEFSPCHYPVAYLPDGKGIALSEDVLALIGPEQYEEFCLPYVNRLSEEFGGVVIHSCGNFEHQLDVLGKVSNLRGLNFGVTETRFEAVWEKFGGKTVIIPHCTAESIVASFRDYREWVEHVLKTKTTNRGLAMSIPPDLRDYQSAKIDTALGKKHGFYDDLWGFLRYPGRVRKLIGRYNKVPV